MTSTIIIRNIHLHELSSLEILISRGKEVSELHDDQTIIRIADHLLSEIHKLQKKY